MAIVISVTTATLLELVDSENPLPQQAVRSAVNKYAEKFGASEALQELLGQMVPGLCLGLGQKFRTESLTNKGEQEEAFAKTALTRSPLPLYEAFVNGQRTFLDRDDMEGLRARALRGEFDIFADDIYSEFLLCGKAGEEAGRAVRKGESLTWRALLVLLEGVDGFWSYKELFERVEGRPCKGPHDARKAYQWVRHLKESIDDAQKAWELPRKLNVDQILDTQRASGRAYVSGQVTACVIKYATS
jgi:hypothetical protein